ncbi:acylneuraminate cytidylyltransferase family protein [Leptospira biflexa]|uniref:acylneuraminate cytidylyltransferase family protein n=1 Tax=Leptospira biflexa TaxID=172 RepID=UPI001090D3AB|nr:acylneuraminate cytidylyltransferase family protein [Leptospira biflexa]TGM44538.1 acylneuraminate cytidylyltransferase family protein [Leptospira biflexa]TGM45421.1 acylneuraminate cytidylyltransferase family protein [Leptospira biflexa]TGM53975.1 acylneuraminate cytidylyltransferase family protein [Leptospira biflexa]
MRILALIPARAGSKRLPGKNIRLLGGKPLIVWSIEVAQKFPEICDILVSTDSSEIANIAKEFGGYVPWLRPDFLSTDESTSIDMAIHALDWYEENRGKVDGIMLLQPTSPFRNSKMIEEGIEIFQKKQTSVVSVSKMHTHPSWAFTIRDNLLVPYNNDNGTEQRSQDLEPTYVVNGSFYLSKPEDLKLTRSFFKPNVSPLLIENDIEAIDIDTLLDFQFAEFLLTKNKIYS